jgi:hypothetical protein
MPETARLTQPAGLAVVVWGGGGTAVVCEADGEADVVVALGVAVVVAGEEPGADADVVLPEEFEPPSPHAVRPAVAVASRPRTSPALRTPPDRRPPRDPVRIGARRDRGASGERVGWRTVGPHTSSVVREGRRRRSRLPFFLPPETPVISCEEKKPS